MYVLEVALKIIASIGRKAAAMLIGAGMFYLAFGNLIPQSFFENPAGNPRTSQGDASSMNLIGKSNSDCASNNPNGNGTKLTQPSLRIDNVTVC